MGANLISNGDLELGTGDVFTSWSKTTGTNSTITEETSDVRKGTRCARFHPGGSGAHCYLNQASAAVAGQQYKVSFWAKGLGEGAACYFSHPFNSGSVFLTTEWKKYEFTGICAVDSYGILISRLVNYEDEDFLIDDLRLEATPVRYAVLTGALPTAVDGTVNLTKSNFGTPKAAIVMTGNASAGNNPQVHAINSVGYWDGTDQNCSYAGINNGQGTAANARGLYNGRIACISVTPGSFTATYEIKNITDGIRITMMAGSTSYARYVTVILIAGHDVEAKTGILDVATGGPTVSSVGFKPTVILTGCAGVGSGTSPQTYHIWSQGGAIFLPSVKNYVLHNFDYTGVTTMRNDTMIDNTRMTGQLSTSYTWTAYLNSMNHAGFVYTYTGSPSADDWAYLALNIPGVNVDLHTLQIPDETGNQAITGVGFKPGVVMAFMGHSKTEGVAAQGMASSVGVSDGVNDGAYGVRAVDEVNTSDCGSKYSASLIHVPTPSGDAYSNATLSSFDSDGYTLNWTDVTGSGSYGFAIAFQDTDDSKKLIGTAGGKIYFKQ